MIWILVFLGTLGAICILFLLPMWLTHFFNMFHFSGGYYPNAKVSNSYRRFKKNFNNIEWKRELMFKTSFFSKDKNKNYIHADVVVVDGVKYRFYPFNYLRYKLFLYKNRTTLENYNQTINSLKQIRKNKLFKLEQI